MFCPHCRAEIPNNSKFCAACGKAIPQQAPSDPPKGPIPGPWPVPTGDPVSRAATTGGVGSMVGGGLIVLGWFVPWLSIGGLASSIASLLGGGSGLGGLGLRAGVGNGLQISLLSLTAGLAAMTSDEGILVFLGLLLWVFAGMMVSILVVAVIIIKQGFGIIEKSPLQSHNDPKVKAMRIRENMENVRGKSVYVFVLLAIVFVISAAIPFGTGILGGGFYLTILGSIVSFFAAYLSKNQVVGL